MRSDRARFRAYPGFCSGRDSLLSQQVSGNGAVLWSFGLARIAPEIRYWRL
jgi:hypothetical protein